MMLVNKMTEEQAVLYCEEQDLDWNESSEILRECTVCDHFVSVDDISAERNIENTTYYDICDQCGDLLENN